MAETRHAPPRRLLGDDPTRMASIGGENGSPKSADTYCERCGAHFIVQLPVDAMVWVAGLRAFTKQHRRCAVARVGA